jgi:hypothetical protein
MHFDFDMCFDLFYPSAVRKQKPAVARVAKFRVLQTEMERSK